MTAVRHPGVHRVATGVLAILLLVTLPGVGLSLLWGVHWRLVVSGVIVLVTLVLALGVLAAWADGNLGR